MGLLKTINILMQIGAILCTLKNKYGYKLLPSSFMEMAIYDLNESMVGQNMQLFQEKHEQTLLLFGGIILIAQGKRNTNNFYACFYI